MKEPEYDCPKCGKKMHIKKNLYILTDPPSIVYECSECNWLGSPWVSDESISESP